MNTQALEGLKIVEFGGYAAGPHIGKMLANFGAVVIHVESVARPDGFRLQYPPYKDGKQHVDGSGCFAIFNDSKFSVTVDVKNAEGLRLARRLTDWADMVIENMRPGVMERIGLGYETLKSSNPDLIMLSTCTMGQTGPRADTPGFGSQLTALAGICGLTGERDGPPQLLYGPYIDFIASTMGAAAVLAALDKRTRTGAGSFLDVSQYECGLMYLAGPLLDYHNRGAIAERMGNDDPEAAPHGAYPCAEGSWVALSCWSDAEFARLADIVGGDARDARLTTFAGRKAHRDLLDRAITGWTECRHAKAAAQALQQAQVHAHAVNTMADLFTDAQLEARQQWRRRTHPVIGHHAYCMPAFDLSEMPGDVSMPAPTLGQHNERVFRELLGMSEAEYVAFQDAGALS